MNQIRKILIAASGTGGHILPAIYIAQKLEELYKAKVFFVGSGRPLEEKLIDSRGYKRYIVKTVGLKRRGIRGILEWILSLPHALLTLDKIFKTEKPDLVLGVGGYVTVLPALIAFFRRKPIVIHEAEPAPGLANKFISLFATKITLAYPGTKMLRKNNTVDTGHPMNPEFYKLNFQKNSNIVPQKILVLGGSQGAESIDRALIKIIPLLKEKKLEIFHQAREVNIKTIKAEYKKEGIKATVTSFVNEIEKLYLWADLIIARSGAGTTREIIFVKRPAILIPLPGAEEQELNAEKIKNLGFGFIIKENAGNDYIEQLKSQLSFLLEQDNYQKIIQEYCSWEEQGLKELSSAEKISQVIYQLL